MSNGMLDLTSSSPLRVLEPNPADLAVQPR